MKSTSQKAIWTPCSVSWTKGELKEIKDFAKLKGVSLSAYVRGLAHRDRPRRVRQIAKLKGKAQSVSLAS